MGCLFRRAKHRVADGLVDCGGIRVDDAVVEIENIMRHIEEGLSAYDAAMKGSGEIGE